MLSPKSLPHNKISRISSGVVPELLLCRFADERSWLVDNHKTNFAMLYSKLLYNALCQYNECRVVIGKQPPESKVPVLTRKALHERGIRISETVWSHLKVEGARLPSHASIHVFPVRDELARIPSRYKFPVLSWQNIRRAVYARGRQALPLEILTALWHARHLFGNRLVVFPLRHSIQSDATVYALLAWRPHGSADRGELRLVPRAYQWTADTWIGFCER